MLLFAAFAGETQARRRLRSSRLDGRRDARLYFGQVPSTGKSLISGHFLAVWLIGAGRFRAEFLCRAPVVRETSSGGGGFARDCMPLQPYLARVGAPAASAEPLGRFGRR